MKRKVVTDKLETFASDLVAALADKLGDHVDSLLERAKDAAIASVTADVQRGGASRAA